MTHYLSEIERVALAAANAALTKITQSHGVWCECELCRARALTDVQDSESYSVEYTVDPD